MVGIELLIKFHSLRFFFNRVYLCIPYKHSSEEIYSKIICFHFVFVYGIMLMWQYINWKWILVRKFHSFILEAIVLLFSVSKSILRYIFKVHKESKAAYCCRFVFKSRRPLKGFALNEIISKRATQIMPNIHKWVAIWAFKDGSIDAFGSNEMQTNSSTIYNNIMDQSSWSTKTGSLILGSFVKLTFPVQFERIYLYSYTVASMTCLVFLSAHLILAYIKILVSTNLWVLW